MEHYEEHVKTAFQNAENGVSKITNHDDICAVFLCDKAYFNKFIYTCDQLVTKGKYKGNICLVIGDDLQGNPLLECNTIKNNNVIIIITFS